MSVRHVSNVDAASSDAAALVHAQRNATWSTHLVAALVHNGVTDAVVSPGSRNTPLVLALDAALAKRVHVVVDERSAGFVALGLARVSGRPVVLLCTSGSAAAHYPPAVIEAHYSRIPLLIVTADRPPELHHNGAGQTIEQDNLYGNFVRWSTSLGTPSTEADPRSWAQMGALAVNRALSGTPGPVHLNAAFREPLWTTGVSYGPPQGQPLVVRPSGRHVADLTALEARVSRARRGIIICGPRAAGPSLADDASFARSVIALGERLGWPVLADAASGVRGRGQVIAAYDALLRSSTFADAMRPDLVLRFGQVPASKPLATWLTASSGATVSIDATGDLHDPTHIAEMLIVSDPTSVCEHLLGVASAAANSPWLASWTNADAKASQTLDRVCADGFWEGGIARAVARALPANALLHVASSMPIRDLENFADRVPTVTANRGANGIDGTIATACGAALSWTGPVVALLGDLAFAHDVGSLITARALRLPITLVVIDNGGGGIFDFLGIAAHERDTVNRYFTHAVAAARVGYSRQRTASPAKPSPRCPSSRHR